MENKINAMLLVNKNCDFAYNLRQGLIKYKCEVSYVNSFEELVNKLMVLRSSMLFFSKDTINEFLAIAQFFNTDLLNKSTIIYVGDNLDDVSKYLNNANFFYCTSANVNTLLINIINHYKLTAQIHSYSVDADILNKMINNHLTSLGFTQKWVGYKFLKECLACCIDNDFNMGSLIRDVYPIVATKNSTTPSNVERSIRNAITKAYNVTHFSNSKFEEFKNGNRKITNRLFIACMLDKLKEDQLFNQKNYA